MNDYPDTLYDPAIISNEEQTLTKEEQEKRIRHFRFFSIGSIIYAFFYTFCLYRNNSGITYPFFVGGTLFYFFLSLKRLGISAKKDSVFYMISLLLLGISTFCTDNGYIIFMNKMGIFVLGFVLMIHNFCTDDGWNFSKYFYTVFQTVFGSVGEIFRPVSDFFLFLRSRKSEDESKSSNGKYVFIGILISIPLILFVLVLLCSADIVFSSMMDEIIFNIQIPENLFGICFMLAFSFFASYCVIAFLEKKKIKEDTVNKRTGEPVLAITVTSILSVIYLLFSGIQIIYLFIGGMELPYGFTYAQYARRGFFQLLFICLMNLILVLICLGRFKENKFLKGILTIISLCTYVMIASSALRMIMYIKYFYLTFLRIFVLWSLFVIFLLMTGVLIHIYKEKFPLFKYCMIVVTVLYIGFSFSHPDYHIAKCNTAYAFSEETSDFFEGEAYSDIYYLSHLSADAAPVLLSEENIMIYAEYYGDEVSSSYEEEDNIIYFPSWILEYSYSMDKRIRNMGLRDFNLSRFKAGRYLASMEKIL